MIAYEVYRYIKVTGSHVSPSLNYRGVCGVVGDATDSDLGLSLWLPYGIGQTVIFSSCGFFFYLLFFLT